MQALCYATAACGLRESLRRTFCEPSFSFLQDRRSQLDRPADLQDRILGHRNTSTPYTTVNRHEYLYRYKLPSFRFRPCAFAPASTRAVVVLKLCDPASDYPLHHSQGTQGLQLPSSDQFADIFFDAGTEAQLNRTRLINQPIFIRFNGRLKSMRIPSLVIDTSSRQITIDWRQLFQDFLLDELKTRLSIQGQ